MVAYFSASGVTEAVAEKIASATGGTIHEIAPAQEYTTADLDWTNDKSRSTIEMKDEKSRPALAEPKTDLSAYDTIYIGFPVWWDLAPRVINTFIEGNDLKGKVLIPFATSGGSSINNSVKDLKRLYPDLNWQQGKLLNRSSDATIKAFVGK